MFGITVTETHRRSRVTPQVAVSWINAGGKYTNVILSLNEDNGGVPGAVLEKWWAQIGRNKFVAGSCCAVTTKRSTGIPVTAGTQYWVVVSTEKKSDVMALWNPNDTKQLPKDAQTEAVWCSSSSGECDPSENNVWTPFLDYPGLAFAVFGK
jgi:hypothetical protein